MVHITISPRPDAERESAFSERFTPKLVDPNLHGSNVTFTVLLDGKYCTAERVYPDFVDVPDAAELVLMECFDDSNLRSPCQEIVERTCEGRCMQALLDKLLANRKLTFGAEFQEYLRDVSIS